MRFDAVEDRLKNLLLAFGPPAKSYHPEYPFWRLQNDGTFWEIPEREEAIARRGERLRTGDVPPSILRAVDARGGFSEPVFSLLQVRPDLVAELTADILEEHFEASFHEEILDAVGMPWVSNLSARGKRSVEFREDLIRLYQHRCAVCGFDGMLGTSQFALEAAHVQWHAHGGPDQPENGILLCSLHHKAFDRGALSLSEDRVILVSQHLHGGPQVTETLVRFAGRPLSRPLEPEKVPSPVFIRWHLKEVFRDPARVVE